MKTTSVAVLTPSSDSPVCGHAGCTNHAIFQIVIWDSEAPVHYTTTARCFLHAPELDSFITGALDA